MAALILAPPSFDTCFVAFHGGEPVGTASLVRHDLPGREDLSPWLAGVFVLPAHRRQGHAAALVRRVEAEARRHGFPVLWLYTVQAAGLYARLGWEDAGEERDGESGRQVRLMRRALGVSPGCRPSRAS